MSNRLRKTDVFNAWFDNLKDMDGRSAILRRLTSVEGGNFGDCDSVGNGVYEMRIHFGPGYRIYYAQSGASIYLLLVGGDKKSQRRDISRAKEIWRIIKEGKIHD